MAAKFPQNIATADDWSSSNAGMGRTKLNDKSPNDLDVNLTGPEWNQQNLEIIAVQEKAGTDGHEPVGTGGPIDRSHDFLLAHFVPRLDLPGFVETWTTSAQFITDWAGIAGVTDRESLYLNTMAGAAVQGVAYNVANAVAVGYVTLNAATIGGWETADMFFQRSTYFAARLQLSGLPATNGDIIQIGIFRDATHYVLFHSTRAAGAWPVWTVEVNDGGSTWSDTLTTGSPSDMSGSWATFEIRTTSSGAYFYYQRGQGTAEYMGPGTQAPENARGHPFIAVTSNAGGETLRNSATAVLNTGVLFGA